MDTTLFKGIAALLACALFVPFTAAASSPSRDALAQALDATTISARDLKTLHYLQNAHGQLEEWSLRLLARLEQGLGPRSNEPIVNGRADLQVQKIAVTYAGYTQNPALSHALRAVADAHKKRLDGLKSMLQGGVSRTTYQELDAPVQSLVATLQSWSEKR